MKTKSSREAEFALERKQTLRRAASRAAGPLLRLPSSPASTASIIRLRTFYRGVLGWALDHRLVTRADRYRCPVVDVRDHPRRPAKMGPWRSWRVLTLIGVTFGGKGGRVADPGGRRRLLLFAGFVYKQPGR